MEKFSLSKSELVRTNSENAFSDLVWNPACNSLVIEPWNAMANTANPVLKLVTGEEGVSKLESRKVSEHKLLSSSWLVQNLSSGLGAVIPYVAAGKFAGGLMRGCGSKINASGELANILKNDAGAQILGAATYDGLKDLKPGESRLGNSLGGAAAFTIFELGNSSTKDLPLLNKVVMRALTGSVGACTQQNVSELVTRNKLVDRDKAASAALSGMVMNVVLPETQKAFAQLADTTAMSLGVGIPIDKFVSKFPEAAQSPSFAKVVDENPWLRVQSGTKYNDFKAGSSLLELNEQTPEALARQIRRRELIDAHDADFRIIADSIGKDGTERAWTNYRNVRRTIESDAKHLENRIAFELSKTHHLLSSAEMSDEIGAWPARDGNSQETQWRKEFSEFLKTSGNFRPGTKFGTSKIFRTADEEIDSYRSKSREELIGTEAVRELQNSGELALFAGGSVRDKLMGRSPKDYDIATSASPEKVEKLFAAKGYKVLSVGKQFGTIKVVIDGETIEITSLRTDGTYSDGRRPDSIKYASSLREDAARRDLTINSLFKDPINGVHYDLFNGMGDLDRGIIRSVGEPAERFAEDKLRMMRVPRFAARYGYEVEQKTLDAISENSKDLNKVSKERIKEELKGILAAPQPSIGLDIMMKTGLMQEVIPEIIPMDGPLGAQDPKWHPEGNAWTHTKLVVDELAKNGNGKNFPLMMSGLLHDIGKPQTLIEKSDVSLSNPRHEFVGAEISKEICQRLKFSKAESTRIEAVISQHMNMHNVRELRQSTLNELLSKPEISDLIEIQNADALGKQTAEAESHREFLNSKLEELRTKEANSLKPKPVFDGNLFNELNVPNSAVRGELLKEARLAEEAGEFKTKEEARDWLRKRLNGPEEISESSDYDPQAPEIPDKLQNRGMVKKDAANVAYVKYHTDRLLQSIGSLRAYKFDGTNLELRYPEEVPDYERITLSELADMVEALPNPSLLKHITVTDYAHKDDAGLKRIYGYGVSVRGITDNLGNVILFRPTDASNTSKTLLHEFVHNMKKHVPEASSEFDLAIEKKTLVLPEGSGFIDSADEAWSRLGDNLLSGDSLQSLITSKLNPSASKAFAKALKQVIENSPTSSSRRNEFQEIIKQILEE